MSEDEEAINELRKLTPQTATLLYNKINNFDKTMEVWDIKQEAIIAKIKVEAQSGTYAMFDKVKEAVEESTRLIMEKVENSRLTTCNQIESLNTRVEVLEGGREVVEQRLYGLETLAGKKAESTLGMGKVALISAATLTGFTGLYEGAKLLLRTMVHKGTP
jgi:hypothetical protein